MDDCRLWTTGSGPLILCHGGPGLWDMFGDLRMPAIRWDQRGGGRSERRGPYTVERMIADLDAVRRRYGLARVSLLGHSWGATLALRYAVAHPDRVEKLVYVSGTGLDEGWEEEFRANFTARLGDEWERWRELRSRRRTEDEERELAVLQWSADFADRSKARGYAERMANPWFEINYECNAVLGKETWPSAFTECRQLEVPTLIIDGAQDLRPRWSVDSLFETLPSAKRVVLEDAGHIPWLEVPDEFEAAVGAFLDPA
ncbi:alpha/beta hydrolase [Saccharothrix violaceirubra]|uniref:alpha/beta fold hydrolase n=1 Tax=Saccharothrix violaceirubra TaxID=413306 RepID=UPI0031F0B2D5